MDIPTNRLDERVIGGNHEDLGFQEQVDHDNELGSQTRTCNRRPSPEPDPSKSNNEEMQNGEKYHQEDDHSSCNHELSDQTLALNSTLPKVLADQGDVQHSSLSKYGCSVSIEVEKTKNIGKEVGFQLDGFEEVVRAEIEGEGVMKQQK
ncbi:hypothetical protein L2E82_34975 [Cichorium intybus]|uniref:Uncharacterized protein n=1 Tax=Cichorium intybus TaxID=13427 RepID=A0ACB9BN13_CICIN|nr:hypothetical protein L2E82_34975 [Cichorium intybus]